jgi:hypothetical protein
MTRDALNHDGEYRQLPVMLTNLWRLLTDTPAAFYFLGPPGSRGGYKAEVSGCVPKNPPLDGIPYRG